MLPVRPGGARQVWSAARCAGRSAIRPADRNVTATGASVGAAPAGEPTTQILVVAVAGITAEPFPGRRPDHFPVARRVGRGLRAEGERGCFLPVGHDPGRGLVGAEVGQVVLAEFGGDVAFEDVGVLGGAVEEHLVPGVGGQRVA